MYGSVISDCSVKPLKTGSIVEELAASCATPTLYFVSPMPEIASGNSFVRSNLHKSDDFIAMFAQRNMALAVASFMEKHLQEFPPNESPEILGGRLEVAMRNGRIPAIFTR